MTRNEKFIRGLLDKAGIVVGGSNPWDIYVHNPRFYKKVARQATLGLGESYTDGWWSCEHLDQFIERVRRADVGEEFKYNIRVLAQVLCSKVVNLQSIWKASQDVSAHYDLGKVFEYMLDKRMVYTCAYWKDAKTLEEAQEHKLELVCKKLRLKPGMTVLDIGCGWGSFAKYAAEHHGVHVTGITISKEQAELGRTLCAGVENVDIVLQDYRKHKGTYDRVASLGMFEHVGPKNYRRYMKKVNSFLKKDGLFLLHTITGNESVSTSEQWINKNIFPNGVIPSIAQIAKAAEKLFVEEDAHSFGPDYDKTLMTWYENFLKSIPKLRETGEYDESFFLKWEYYLLGCAGSFRARTLNLRQILYSKHGITDGLAEIRTAA